MNVQDYGIKVRSEAIGMLKAGLAQKDVASRFQVSLRSIERWWRNEKLGNLKKQNLVQEESQQFKKQLKLLFLNLLVNDVNPLGFLLK